MAEGSKVVTVDLDLDDLEEFDLSTLKIEGSESAGDSSLMALMGSLQPKPESGPAGDSSLGALMGSLQGQMSSGAFLKENTAETWEQANPEAARAYREALEKAKLSSSEGEKVLDEANVAGSSSRVGGAPAQGTGASGDSLDTLVHQLHQNIRESDWLSQNTADQWERENPETAEAYRAAVKDNQEQAPS